MHYGHCIHRSSSNSITVWDRLMPKSRRIHLSQQPTIEISLNRHRQSQSLFLHKNSFLLKKLFFDAISRPIFLYHKVYLIQACMAFSPRQTNFRFGTLHLTRHTRHLHLEICGIRHCLPYMHDHLQAFSFFHGSISFDLPGEIAHFVAAQRGLYEQK